MIKKTMSFGVAQFVPGKTIEDNVSIADGRLYTAKETGRNKVVSTDT
jgi:PleD family two-component response regulator